MKDYRQNYGDTMKDQTNRWLTNHPEYYNCWRIKRRFHYNEYMRRYMRKYRMIKHASKNSMVNKDNMLKAGDINKC